jgi:hypothetical protein
MTFDAIETRAIEAIRHADHFTASLFLGRSKYRIEKRPTVLAAMQAAREIEQDPAAHTRRALVYAITPDGYATLLSAGLIANCFPSRLTATSDTIFLANAMGHKQTVAFTRNQERMVSGESRARAVPLELPKHLPHQHQIRRT